MRRFETYAIFFGCYFLNEKRARRVILKLCSSVEIFNKLKYSKNTIELPLSTCYRCPKNVIKLVQHIVPNIQYYENAIDGEIVYNSSYLDLKDGDMVICRTTLPLVKLYIKLIKENITSYIKGVDIGINLLELIDKIDDEDISEFKIKLDKDRP